MELNYVKSQSTVKPPEIEFFKSSVYLRQNISFDGEFWNYEEACLTPEEFNEYAAVKGIDNSGNQLIIMEAIADLYELIMSKS